MGRHDEAIQTCRAGLQRHPAYLSARVTLGRALIETGDYDGAREELQTVLRSAPENLAAIRGLAQIHERLGHSTEMDPSLAAMMNAEVERISLAAAARPAAPPETVVEAAAEMVLDARPAPVVAPHEPALALHEPAVALHVPALNAPEPAPVFAFAPALEPAPAIEAAPEPEPEPILEPDLELQPEPVFVQAADPGPDPVMIATLARLERFLVAIDAARHP